MKPFFQFGIFFIVFWFLIVFSSCHKNDDTFFLNTDNDEIFIPLKTTDTILYALVDNIKIPIYLSIPKICNNESYPAVVVLHGSDGMWKNNNFQEGIMSGQSNEWRKLFDQNCIVGAFVDSYSTRGCTERTGKWITAPDNFKISSQFIRNRDANEALSLLRRLRFNNGTRVVRSTDIGLLGFSDGASAVAATLYDSKSTPSNWKWSQKFDGKEYSISSGVKSPPEIPEAGGFACGVFYYGGSLGNDYWGGTPCGDNGSSNFIYRNYAPILYQIPNEGYLTENILCAYNLLKAKGAAVELKMYYGVSHGFDFDHLEQSYQARENTIKWFKDILNID